MRLGLYARVSTDEQAKDGFSIPAQLRVLNAWSILKNASSVTEYVDDGYSAKNLNRPGIRRLLDDCRAGNLDVVVTWRLDRLSRNLRDLLITIEDVFKPHGVEFVSATESIDTSSPSGRLMTNILGSLAQNEREVTSERVTMVMLDLARQCKHLGGTPMHGLGVNADQTYHIVEHEAAGIRMAVDLRISGYSVNDIIGIMSENGYLTRKGKPFTITGLYELFRNPKIAGYYTYNRLSSAQRSGKRNGHRYKNDADVICIPNGIPAIISQEKWEALQVINKKGEQIGGQNKARNVYIASGLCRCGKCGGSMVISNGGRNRDGSYWRVYRCKNKCVPGVEYKKMDSFVLSYLRSIASDPHVIDGVLRIAKDYAAMHNEDIAEDLKPLNTRLQEIEAAKGNMLAFIAKAGADAPRGLLDEIKRYDAETDDIKRQISRIQSNRLTFDPDAISNNIKRVVDIDSRPEVEQREIVQQLVNQIIVHEDTIEVRLTTNSTGSGSAPPEALVKLFTFSFARSLVMRCNA